MPKYKWELLGVLNGVKTFICCNSNVNCIWCGQIALLCFSNPKLDFEVRPYWCSSCLMKALEWSPQEQEKLKEYLKEYVDLLL